MYVKSPQVKQSIFALPSELFFLHEFSIFASVLLISSVDWFDASI